MRLAGLAALSRHAPRAALLGRSHQARGEVRRARIHSRAPHHGGPARPGQCSLDIDRLEVSPRLRDGAAHASNTATTPSTVIERTTRNSLPGGFGHETTDDGGVLCVRAWSGRSVGGAGQDDGQENGQKYEVHDHDRLRRGERRPLHAQQRDDEWRDEGRHERRDEADVLRPHGRRPQGARRP